MVPLAGLEPTLTAPEADALSTELQGLGRVRLPRSQDPPTAAKGPQLALPGLKGTTTADRVRVGRERYGRDEARQRAHRAYD